MIKGYTISKPGFTATTFYITENSTVFCYNKDLGFFRHAFTFTELRAHAFKLVLDGFTVKPLTAKQLETAYKRYSRAFDGLGVK